MAILLIWKIEQNKIVTLQVKKGGGKKEREGGPIIFDHVQTNAKH